MKIRRAYSVGSVHSETFPHPYNMVPPRVGYAGSSTASSISVPALELQRWPGIMRLGSTNILPSAPPAEDSSVDMASIKETILDATGALTTHTIDGVSTVSSSEGERPPGEPWHNRKPMVKYMHHVKGKTQMQRCNQIADPVKEKLPLFKAEPISASVMANTFPTWTKKPKIWRNLLQGCITDRELVGYLKLEAAFVPRTTSLLLQLKNKARRYLDQFDLSIYTSEQVYEFITRAVGVAMLISPEEERVRALLNHPMENKARHYHQQFFRDGILELGELECPRYTRKKRTVWRVLYSKLRTRAMPF